MIHRLMPMTPEQRRKPWLASDRTYCGTDAYRRGAKVEGRNVGDAAATCKACLKKQEPPQIDESEGFVIPGAYDRIKGWVEVSKSTHWVQIAADPDARPIFPGEPP